MWGRGEGVFSCLRFENFSLLPLKTADLEAVGNFYPAPCRIGLSKHPTQNMVNNEQQERGMMMAAGGPFCPVNSFDIYVSHLNPGMKAVFQQPKGVA